MDHILMEEPGSFSKLHNMPSSNKCCEEMFRILKDPIYKHTTVYKNINYKTTNKQN